MVGIEGGEFAFVSGPNSMDDAVPEAQRAAPAGTVIETCPGAAALVEAVARRFKRAPRAAVADLLDTLATLGQARRADTGYAA
ncbi:MAG: hypothetical protein CL433_13265 [Acidimicrobiaceae bacterium]|nr:hypothetical protein [Acidimicrobiaceae bacterium]